MKYYLAIDIGASSGRHMLGSMEGGRLVLEEIHRFSNSIVTSSDGKKMWDIGYLFGEVIKGMKKCAVLGKIPESVGIDTWAVDFVLLDKNDNLLSPAICYRDDRTKGMDKKVYEHIGESELYGRNGIQKQIFNTIYQLMAIKEQEPTTLEKAETFLMIPDYLHFLLCGKKTAEYTNATTTQLVSSKTNTWDMELIEKLGYPSKIFPKISLPGSELGALREEVANEVGFDCKVVIPATHDTASAVMAVPSNQEQPLYISSGTWSLMGTQRKEADCREKSRTHNFTNEGGYEYRYRYLKNIMGLWMIQSLRHEYHDKYSFAELCAMAESDPISSIVDCGSDRFLAPKSMEKAVQGYCLESGQEVPNGVGQLAAVIYRSLAQCYSNTLDEIRDMTNHDYSVIHIVGGGANADYLNRLTAKATGKKILAGPTEATAVGNLVAQMLHGKVWENLKEARDCIGKSFEIKEYEVL